jgi:hypothetical protein
VGGEEVRIVGERHPSLLKKGQGSLSELVGLHLVDKLLRSRPQDG